MLNERATILLGWGMIFTILAVLYHIVAFLGLGNILVACAFVFLISGFCAEIFGARK